MKGKTGKSSAMRGGGLARKGVGMALKGGGIARKGTGSNATPGGKVAKMAMGGNPGDMATGGYGSGNVGSSPSRSSSPRDGGFAGAGGSAGGGGGSTSRSGMSSTPGTRSVSDSSPFRSGKGTPVSGMDSFAVKPEGKYPTVNRSGKGSLRGSMSGKDQSRLSGKDQSRLKKGGKVKGK
jgi:hypothetical protein